MGELFVETRTAVGEDGRLHSFDYYVVIGEMEVGGRFACESYGVKVAEQGGVLQSIFEYQTMICALTGMDASNASVYDGASAAAEAVAMCRDRKRNTTVQVSPGEGDVTSSPCCRVYLRKFSKALVSYSVTGASTCSAGYWLSGPESPPTWSSWAWVHTT